MTFKKGVSPNPGGLSPRKIAMQRRLEGLTVKAVNALERVLDDDNATHGERLAAAREVFDRAIGKAKQQASLEVTHAASPHLVALVNLAAQSAARVSSHPSDQAKPLIIDNNSDATMKPALSFMADVDVDEADLIDAERGDGG